MNAKEMFEQLGYKLVKNPWNDERFITYKYIQYQLDFDLQDKSYCFTKDEYEYLGYASVDVEFHNVITQQMKELGWLDD